MSGRNVTVRLQSRDGATMSISGNPEDVAATYNHMNTGNRSACQGAPSNTPSHPPAPRADNNKAYEQPALEYPDRKMIGYH